MTTTLKPAGGQAIVRDSNKGSRMGKKAKVLTKREARSKGERGAFALHLAALLAERDWSNQDFADRLSVAGMTISEAGIRTWLRGDGMPKAEDLRTVGKALGLGDSRHVLPPG